MIFGSLFAGIGGMDLGLERAGMTCSWQVEIDPFCRQILAKHWPDVRRHDDVTTFPPTNPEDWQVDLIVGGFPCQDISCAGPRAGIDGKRSGLWSEFDRVIRSLRPRFVLVENVPRLLSDGLGIVLRDLAQSGYDAEWLCLPASFFGLPHRRSRLFLVAYPHGQRFHPGQDERRIFGEVANSQDHSQEQGRGSRVLELIRGRSGRVRAFPPPGIRRVDDGSPDRLDRIRTIGNAVPPILAEWVGRKLIGFAAIEPGTGGA